MEDIVSDALKDSIDKKESQLLSINSNTNKFN